MVLLAPGGSQCETPKALGLGFVFLVDTRWQHSSSSSSRIQPLVLLLLIDSTVCSVSSLLLTAVRLFLQVLVGALESSGDIVSVSCCDNEIFILKGDRDVIRLSDCPEGVTSDREHRCCPLLTSRSTADPPHNSPGPSLPPQCLSSLRAWPRLWPRPLPSCQWAQWKQLSQSERWPSLWKAG